MFKKDQDGNVFWLPTSLEETVEFKAKLLENNPSSEHAISNQVVKQLNSFSTKILEGSANLSRNNKLYLDTIKRLINGSFSPVDIILPIYGGLHIIEDCLNSISTRTFYPHRIIVVDDASPDDKTREFLKSWAKRNPQHTLILQKKNKGFAATVNTGIRNSNNRYICVLNSDVLVTDNWLTKLVLALESDPSHAIVNPTTNNTALIDIPMHPGLSYIDMNQGLESLSSHKYPEIMPTGFCFMFKRELISKVGFFDESYGSYGEEALAIDTPILTPKGWKNIEHISQGDFVFDNLGNKVRVIKATEIFYNRPCYEITFSDGEKLVADEGHKWAIWDKKNLEIKRVKTFELNVNDWIPRQKLIRDFSKQELILDPYILGLWLGDGHTNDSKITSFKTLLRNLNLLNNKHIPDDYLFNGYWERMKLLQGLMDTAGSCSTDGKCVFYNTNKNLVDGVAFLVRSLGRYCSVIRQKGKNSNGWKVTFRASKDLPIFSLPRKYNRQPDSIRNHTNFIKIKSIKNIKSKPVKCISVDNESHIFLAGKSLTPTGNSDYWMRTLAYANPDGSFPRYKAVLADDTYLFHERGSSFGALGNEPHMQIRRGGSDRFHKLWPQFKSWRRHNKLEDQIQYLKSQIPDRVIEKDSPYNIAFLVFSAGFCGGMSYITDIANEMVERGINVKIVQVKRAAEHKTASQMGELRCGAISFEDPKDIIDNFATRVFDTGLIIAATNEMQQIAACIATNFPKLTNLLFSQSFDPGLSPNEEIKKNMEQQYHTAPYILSNAKWIDTTIQRMTKRSTFGYVSPGVNHKLFYPRGRDKGDDRPTVAIFLNPADPYRGFDRGAEVAYNLSKLAAKEGVDLRVLGVGVESVQSASYITCVGALSQTRLATLLATEVDIVCDPVVLHSYGMPSLEGMASDCVPVTWDNLGINEYATSGLNSIILPRESTPKNVADKIFNLLKDPNELNKMKSEAIKAAKPHNRKTSVNKFISVLENALHLKREKRNILVVTPHLRKHGGPTTILHTAEILSSMGHDVTLSCIHNDINPEIIKDTKIPISINWQNPKEYDVVIVNSDNEHTEFFSYAKWAKKKVLLKLSHNPRFLKLEDDALKLEWDAICTSTNWLIDACAKPQTDSGWTHPPREASRIGWYHYGHRDFDCKYTNRTYFANGQMNICTLIHHHPLKGSSEALKALTLIKERYQDKVNIFGIGEWPQFQQQCPPWMQYYLNLDRKQMAQLLKQMDIFISASHSEGLGRMSLEAMSSSCLVIKTPTNAEFEKDMNNCIVSKGFKADDILEALDKLGPNDDTFKTIVKNGYHTAESLADPLQYKEAWGQLIEDLFNEQ